MYKLWWVFLAVLCTVAAVNAAERQSQVDPQFKQSLFKCDGTNTGFCPELSHNYSYDGHYSGHDEPSLIFYSNKAGSGNNTVYRMTLPRDPATAPRQDSTGGTFSFQLHPAMWFGMVLCDTQSAPNFTHECQPDTDANIFDSTDPNAPDFIGHHPGSAFLELQFYPPGGLNTCSDPSLWCVAMVIFSVNVQDLTNRVNNSDCQLKVGIEPSNFAFLTHDGRSQTAADPLNPDLNTKFGIFPGQTFQMNPGDNLVVSIHDTPEGLRAIVRDLTLRTEGSMTASTGNGFAQVNFDPDPDPLHPSKTCSSTPYVFHPQFATSNEHTRAVWTTHTYNIAFSDEIGHFEFCNAVDQEGGNCIQPGVDDHHGLDADDQQGSCYTGDFLSMFGLQPLSYCIAEDFDFNATSYQARSWPGTGDPAQEAQFKSTPIRFSSPQFHKAGDGEGDELHDYNRVAFEADLPGIEFFSNPQCDVLTGAGCTNPPAGAAFYPIFSTARSSGNCMWQFGGPNLPGTTNNFGGTSTTEYGDILAVNFIASANASHPNGSTVPIFSDYRRILPENPCRASGDDND
jgi:hypothetical protein